MNSRILLLPALFLLLFACDASKRLAKKFDPSGSWDYVISDTPMGDIPGTLVLMKDNEEWEGKLTSDQGSIDLSGIQWEEKKMTASFDYDGNQMKITTEFMEDQTISGSIGGDFGDFPLSGKRKMAN